ncbi:hypothetical protein AVEN_189189-1 [Araneus ventricosus]|uniref:Uncharacterized protein n=1 Tax=Araneus ventricosus TaxID=182803 RepID=A0A4Y2F7U5_ARAVE|nr:hypothetical protein AVEN_189189-1 [Araneus ventricosus]
MLFIAQSHQWLNKRKWHQEYSIIFTPHYHFRIENGVHAVGFQTMASLETDIHAIYNPLPPAATPLQKAVLRKFISNHPDLTLSLAVHLNGSCCDSSSAEARDLVAIGPTPPVEGTLYHCQRGSPSHYCTHQGSQRKY